MAFVSAHSSRPVSCNLAKKSSARSVPVAIQRSRSSSVRVLAHKGGAAVKGLDTLTGALHITDNSMFACPTAPPQPENPPMFCYQCEQTMNCSGCSDHVGVCGKTEEVAALQDLLIYACKGLGSLAHHAKQQGHNDAEVDSFLLDAIFSTLTNVDFDDHRFVDYVVKAQQLQARLRQDMQKAGLKLPTPPKIQGYFEPMPHPLEWRQYELVTASASGPGARPSVEELVEVGRKTGIAARRKSLGETLCGLQELLVYGLKGLGAYAAHAEALGYTSAKTGAFVAEALHFLSTPASADIGNVLGMCLKLGEANMGVMAMLSEAHSNTFGHPTPTTVSLVPEPGKSILITGHDMHDLKLLLDQTEGTGINVYTHGEMLPAHGYPGLKKYKHLKGHFGGAWYRQRTDFAHFPGAVLVTTNCVLIPTESYKDNIFTTNATGVPGSRHLANKDFSAVIKRAKELPGFDKASALAAAAMHKKEEVTVGFGHHAVLGVAGEVIKAIQEKRLEHIFLIGGCDGSEPQRKYYGELYKYMPQTSMILTLGCGKFRIFDGDFGTLPPAADGTGALPRLLDMGQCNDAYSAIVVADALAKALKTDINSLPLSLDLSWFEQKAVAVLLSLLHLGVHNIRLGPRLPAFLTQDALNVLVEKFNLIPADSARPESDVKKMLATP